jgi:hypothetical protein
MVKFGPPAHRTINQIMEAIRCNRNRKVTESAQARNTGKKSDEGTSIQAAQKVPKDVSGVAQPPDGTRKTFSFGGANKTIDVDSEPGTIIIKDTSGETAKEIRIRLADVTAGAAAEGAVELRELDYCDGTTAKKILVLASAPYTPA